MNLGNKTRSAVLISALLAASSIAMAQGSGGGGPAGTDPNAGTNAGATREGGDMQASGAMAHSKSTRKHHMKSSKTKPASDSMNMPSADAASATKGQ
jgi:hypothetical protein